MHFSSDQMLVDLGARVRATRLARGWTQAELARKAGVSLRFLIQVEKGETNISLLRLVELSQALSISLVTLMAGLGPVRDDCDRLAALSPPRRMRALQAADRPEKIALVGLRGAGKTTVGTVLADQLGVPMVEVDHEVEEAAGMRLAELFEYYGAARYRQVEQEVLERLLTQPGGMVLATGGSVVMVPELWSMVRRSARTVWLRASPSSHLSRVQAQGDFRPMRGRTDALAELREILSQREPLYALAELALETDSAPVTVTADRIRGWLDEGQT